MGGRYGGRAIQPRGKLAPVLIAAGVLAAASGSAAAHDGTAFEAWLAQLRGHARAAGVTAPTIDTALAEVRFLPRVVELDRRQPEGSWTLARYLNRVVSRERIERGRAFLEAHRTELEQVALRYGVQPRFIVALLGIESDYGRVTGDFRVVDALATLAFEGRRRDLFRRELIHALRILDSRDIGPDGLRGSWAGAMGQPQFMPSSFHAYAVDHDGDGRRDIWSTRGDVFASVANYLRNVGWRSDRTWGREVRLPARFDRRLSGLQIRKPLAEWQALGVRPADGGALPERTDVTGSVLLFDGGRRAFIVYENFRATMRWNRSQLFATAVGLLSDGIGERTGAGETTGGGGA